MQRMTGTAPRSFPATMLRMPTGSHGMQLRPRLRSFEGTWPRRWRGPHSGRPRKTILLQSDWMPKTRAVVLLDIEPALATKRRGARSADSSKAILLRPERMPRTRAVVLLSAKHVAFGCGRRYALCLPHFIAPVQRLRAYSRVRDSSALRPGEAVHPCLATPCSDHRRTADWPT
jgi:hypothetical protein